MRYLSREWIDAAHAALEGAAPTAPSPRIVIDQHIEGVASYRITVDTGATSLTASPPQPSEPADITFRQDFDTARAIAQGTTDAHQAFLLGKIHFTGNVELLIERRDSFRWIASVLAPVMADTSF